MGQYTLEPFLSEEQITIKIKELAEKINKDFQGEDVLLVGLLRGSYMFLSDLSKYIKVNTFIDFMMLSSYGNNNVTSYTVKVLKDLEEDIYQKNVILVEDIVDTGHTLAKVINLLQTREPKTLSICTLLDKRERREIPIRVKYIGFVIPDKFIVGYGLDYQQKHRNLLEISIVNFIKEEK